MVTIFRHPAGFRYKFCKLKDIHRFQATNDNRKNIDDFNGNLNSDNRIEMKKLILNDPQINGEEARLKIPHTTNSPRT